MLLPSGPSNARMMIVAECVSYRDLQSNTILNDREFDRMLEDAGVNRTECFITAFIRSQITGQNFDLQVAQTKKAVTPAHVPLHNRMVRKELLPHVEALGKDIDLVKPKIILALGNGSLFALTGKWGIKNWRSSLLEYVSPNGHKCLVIPTYTPSFVQSVWKERNTVIFDIRKAWGLARSDEPISAPEYNFLIEPSFPATTKCLNDLLRRANELRQFKLSVDIETRAGHIACIGVAWSATDAICIPLMRAVVQEMDNWQSRIHYWSEHEEPYILHLLYRLLSHPNVEVVGQNFIYDAQYFYRWLHYVPRFARDTMLAQHVMFSSMPKGLDVLSALHCAYHVYWKDESKNWDPKLGERQLWSYNCVDAVRTYEIDESQQNAISAWTANGWPQLREIHDFQQSLFWPVLAAMNRGLRVNHASKARLSEELAAAIGEREKWLEEVLGHPLNIKSPVQMKELFYRVLAQREVISRKTHQPTCDDQALERIASREPLLGPVCSKIRELRSLGVFKSTFVEAPVDADERMRCSFNIAGTEGFRFSSSENAFGSGLNLQNIPEGNSEEGLPNIRELFITDEEPEPAEFFDVDLDSADLRIVVKESNCALMQQWLDEGKKPYVEVAKEYYQDDSITKEHNAYKAFKVICHATNYLGKGPTILERMPKSAKLDNSLTADNITKIQEWYFGKFPEIKAWHEKTCNDFRRNQYVENIFGYRIYNFDRMEGTIFNQVIAIIPQSTVACLINRGWKNIYDNEPDIEVLLQVHDSLAGQYPIAKREICRAAVIRHCSIELPYPVPLVIPVGIKTSDVSWGACE